jgi:hypothetical protein
MCTRVSIDIHELINSTNDPEELRMLLAESFGCGACSDGVTLGDDQEDSACRLYHQLEFRNLLAYLAGSLELKPRDEQ